MLFFCVAFCLILGAIRIVFAVIYIQKEEEKKQVTKELTQKEKERIKASNEKEEIKKNVLAYEPHLALFVDDHDALLFYRRIANIAKEHLKKGGSLYFEINQYLGEETVDLIAEMGFQAFFYGSNV